MSGVTGGNAMGFLISQRGPGYTRLYAGSALAKSGAAGKAAQALPHRNDRQASVRRGSPFRLQSKLPFGKVTKLRIHQKPPDLEAAPSTQPPESAGEKIRYGRDIQAAARLPRKNPPPGLLSASEVAGPLLGSGRFLRLASAQDQSFRTPSALRVQVPKQSILLAHDNPKAQVSLLEPSQIIELPVGALIERQAKRIKILELITVSVSGVQIDFLDGQRPVRFDAELRVDIAPGTALIEADSSRNL